jgi:hypothetical protein
VQLTCNPFEFSRGGVLPVSDHPRPDSLPARPHFLRGPVATKFSPITPHPTLSQICIKSEEMANLLDGYLVKIIFFKKDAFPQEVVNEEEISKISISGNDAFSFENLANTLVS